jgi:hypothetical protein
MFFKPHFTENAFALELLFKNPQRLIDVVMPDRAISAAQSCPIKAASASVKKSLQSRARSEVFAIGRSKWEPRCVKSGSRSVPACSSKMKSVARILPAVSVT